MVPTPASGAVQAGAAPWWLTSPVDNNGGMPRVSTKTVVEHRRAVLDRVYLAFEELIFERGYAAVTLADIARQAEMSRTAIYNYFPDKESLLLAYTSREMDDYLSRLRIELGRAPGPLEQLDVYVQLQISYFATHHVPSGPALSSVLPAEAAREMRHHGIVLEEALTRILADAATAGLIPRDVADDPATLRLVLSCLSALPVRNVAGAQLRDLITSTQAFLRRAIGADRSVSSASVR